MKLTEFIKFLETERDSCLMRADALTNDERRDEANMLKIRANIFDIFAVISRSSENRLPQDRIDFIKDKIETIPAAWKASLAAAEKQYAHDKAMTERIKLQAMLEISQKWSDIMEENND